MQLTRTSTKKRKGIPIDRRFLLLLLLTMLPIWLIRLRLQMHRQWMLLLLRLLQSLWEMKRKRWKTTSPLISASAVLDRQRFRQCRDWFRETSTFWTWFHRHRAVWEKTSAVFPECQKSMPRCLPIRFHPELLEGLWEALELALLMAPTRSNRWRHRVIEKNSLLLRWRSQKTKLRRTNRWRRICKIAGQFSMHTPITVIECAAEKNFRIEFHVHPYRVMPLVWRREHVTSPAKHYIPYTAPPPPPPQITPTNRTIVTSVLIRSMVLMVVQVFRSMMPLIVQNRTANGNQSTLRARAVLGKLRKHSKYFTWLHRHRLLRETNLSCRSMWTLAVELISTLVLSVALRLIHLPETVPKSLS